MKSDMQSTNFYNILYCIRLSQWKIYMFWFKAYSSSRRMLIARMKKVMGTKGQSNNVPLPTMKPMGDTPWPSTSPLMKFDMDRWNGDGGGLIFNLGCHGPIIDIRYTYSWGQSIKLRLFLKHIHTFFLHWNRRWKNRWPLSCEAMTWSYILLMALGTVSGCQVEQGEKKKGHILTRCNGRYTQYKYDLRAGESSNVKRRILISEPGRKAGRWDDTRILRRWAYYTSIIVRGKCQVKEDNGQGGYSFSEPITDQKKKDRPRGNELGLLRSKIPTLDWGHQSSCTTPFISQKPFLPALLLHIFSLFISLTLSLLSFLSPLLPWIRITIWLHALTQSYHREGSHHHPHHVKAIYPTPTITTTNG